MKKTNAKKLVLKVETIKSLNDDALRAVAGGVSDKLCARTTTSATITC
jgi:hypothetical protein